MVSRLFSKGLVFLLLCAGGLSINAAAASLNTLPDVAQDTDVNPELICGVRNASESSDVPVRVEPNRDADITYGLRPTETGAILNTQRLPDGAIWYFIQVDNLTATDSEPIQGWVRAGTITPITECGGAAPEANPAPAQNAASVPASGLSISGSLTSGQDETYVVALTAGDELSITMTSNDFDAFLYLRDAAGNVVAKDDDSGGNRNALLSYSVVQGGNYTIGATGVTGSAAGAFDVLVEVGAEVVAQAPTNTLPPPPTATPQPVVYCALTNARVRTCASTSCALIDDIPAGSTVNVTGQAQGQRIGGSTTWYVIPIAGMDGYSHSSIFDRSCAGATGSQPGSGNTSQSAGTGTQATLTPAPATAADCNSGSSSNTAASLFDVAGQQQFQVNVNRPTTLTANLSISQGQGDWGVGLAVLDASGSQIALREVFDESPSSSTSLSLRIPSSGRFTIVVRGDASHDYTYTVNWSCN